MGSFVSRSYSQRVYIHFFIRQIVLLSCTLFFGSGASLFDGGPAGGLVSDAAKASYELIYRWRSDGILPSEISASLVTNLFNENRQRLWSTGLGFLAKAEGVPFGVAPLPIVSATGERATPFLTAEGVFISAHSKGKDESLALAKFLAGEERLSSAARSVVNV